MSVQYNTCHTCIKMFNYKMYKKYHKKVNYQKDVFVVLVLKIGNDNNNNKHDFLLFIVIRITSL